MANFTRPKDVVVACTGGADWALLLIAEKGLSGRKISPVVYATRSSLLYAICPTKGLRVANNDHKEALAEMISNDFQVVKSSTNVLAFAETSLLNNIKAWPYREPLQDFALQQTSTFTWMYSSSKFRDDVENALRLCRYLIDKHHLGDWTMAEKERAGTISIMKGKQYV